MLKRVDDSTIESGEYRQAGTVSAHLMAQAQEMANGPALDAEQEAVAKERLWKPSE